MVGVFIKSALTAEQCVSTKGQKRMKKKILRTASFALATALSLSVCASAFVSDGTNNNVTTSVLPDSADNAVLNWATKVGKAGTMVRRLWLSLEIISFIHPATSS